jgi:hypothetical protein
MLLATSSKGSAVLHAESRICSTGLGGQYLPRNEHGCFDLADPIARLPRHYQCEAL